MTLIRDWKCPSSGRTYPASVSSLTEAIETGARPGIALAVKRDRGIAHRVGDPVASATPRWLAKARSAGATEIHVIDASANPQAVLDDLRGGGA